jgi:hypothetical protein
LEPYFSDPPSVEVLQVPVSEVPAELLSTMMLSGVAWLAGCR